MNLTDPLLYDRLIRTHQTESERARDRSTRGFAGTLEADLVRSEAKLDELKSRRENGSDDVSAVRAGPRSNGTGNAKVKTPSRGVGLREPPSNIHEDGDSNNDYNDDATTSTASSTKKATKTLTSLPQPDNDFSSLTRDEAGILWTETMTRRFLAGEDDDFKYETVDNNEKWDDVREEERDAEERWFDGEEENDDSWEDGGKDEDGGAGQEQGKEQGDRRKLVGETGVQDF